MPNSPWKLLLPLLVLTAAPWAQDTRGTIFGHVTDPQNAPVSDARVVITNNDTSVNTDLKTNECRITRSKH